MFVFLFNIHAIKSVSSLAELDYSVITLPDLIQKRGEKKTYILTESITDYIHKLLMATIAL